MQQAFAEALSRLPLTRSLAMTLARAHDYAAEQRHRHVTLEHLLLALTEDAEAGAVLAASSVDLARVATEVSAHVGRIEDRIVGSEPISPNINADVSRILEYSAAAARQSRRGRDISGAIVLAAIVGDGKSTAANVLRSEGLTFETAIKALKSAQAVPPATAPPTAVVPMPVPAARSGAPATTPQPASRATELPAPPAPPPPAPQPVVREAPAPSPPPKPAVTAASAGPDPLWGPQPNSTEDILASVRRRIEAGRPASGTSTNMPASAASAEPDIPVEAWTPAASRELSAAPTGGIRMPPPLPASPQARNAAPSGSGDLAARLDDIRRNVSGTAAGSRPTEALVPWPEAAAPPAAILPEIDYAFDGNVAGPPYADYDDAGGPHGVPPALVPLAQRVPRGPLPRPRLDVGALAEALPRQLKVGHRSAGEVRIARSDLRSIRQGLGSGSLDDHESVVGTALSLRLRAPDGGFYIEPTSPETLWIEEARTLSLDDLASWSWSVTPERRGRRRLQLIASARVIGADGTVAETAFPDRTFEVKVSAHAGRAAMRAAGWLIAVLIGGAIALYGSPLATALASLITRTWGA
jgi:hypothetical protein